VKLVDANVLLYAVNRADAHHDTARSWLDTALGAAETLLFADVVLLAFLRLSTNPAIFTSPLTIDEAFDVVDEWLSHPAVGLASGADYLPHMRRLLSGVGSGGNLVNDAYLAAVALAFGAEIVSFDSDFGRFPGVRWRPPAA
jgi:uncharacterized protein